MDLNYIFPVLLIKSGEEKEGRVPIRIIPNSPEIDRQNEKIILKAFSKETIDDYLATSKIIDYDHKSILGKNDFEKSQAIIGEAEFFYIDEKKGVPVCEGFLFRDNPIVSSALFPALKSGSKIYGASIGGRVLQKSVENDPITKKQSNVISKISINHIAICPRVKAVNVNTSIELKKSCSGNGSCEEGQKCKDCDCEYTYQFDSFNSFIKSFETNNDILKSLEAGNSTSIVNLTGGQAIQKQSLEGVNYEKIMKRLPLLIEDLVQGLSVADVQTYMNYLIATGFSRPEAIEVIKLFSKNKAKFLMLKK